MSETNELKFFHVNMLGNANERDRCIIEKFVHGIDAHSPKVHVGEPLAPIYPPDAKIFLTGSETGLELCSLVGNTRNMMLVSTQFRRLIEEACVGVPIECLPVSIYDHRKRLLSADYHIINPLGTFDCLDMKKTHVVWSPTIPDEIIHIDSFVLDRAKVAEAPQLFRMHRDPTSYVVGRRLARAMYDAKLSNIVWGKLPFND